MSDTTRSTQPASKRSLTYRLFATREGRYLLLTAVMGAIVGYLVGINTAYMEMSSVKLLLQQSRSENQKMKSDMAGENARAAAMEGTIAKLRSDLEDLVPAENTYNIKSNQSLIVADGRLTVGVVGPPAAEGVTLNINGKRQTLAPGDAINVPVGTANCRVGLQSFDMFRALVTASCGTR
ncbi:MAG TPA: hypothetical protein VFP60_18330 [Pseudolabrys sp.]|nr:hypothetical protein [Pseudolabrys sp.]